MKKAIATTTNKVGIAVCNGRNLGEPLDALIGGAPEGLGEPVGLVELVELVEFALLDPVEL